MVFWYFGENYGTQLRRTAQQALSRRVLRAGGFQGSCQSGVRGEWLSCLWPFGVWTLDPLLSQRHLRRLRFAIPHQPFKSRTLTYLPDPTYPAYVFSTLLPPPKFSPPRCSSSVLYSTCSVVLFCSAFLASVYITSFAFRAATPFSRARSELCPPMVVHFLANLPRLP